MKKPTPAELNESAMNHFARGQGVQAAQQLQWALLADPNYAEAWSNRGMILYSLNDPFDAVQCYERAIEIDPRPEYYNGLGICWSSMQQFKTAKVHYTKALTLNPDFAEAMHNLAFCAKMSGDTPQSIRLLEKAIKIKPEQPDFHLNLAASLLQEGLLKDGWREYRWRYKSSMAFHRRIPLPEWDGSPNQTVLAYAEQGFGDAIQFVRYVPLLAKQYGLKVYVEVKKPLTSLIETMCAGVVTYGDPVPADVTAGVSIMDLPMHCGINSISDIPHQTRYLFPPHSKEWGFRVQGPGYKAGLCWQAGQRPYQPELTEIALRKSIDPAYLRPLGDLPNITWFSLQKEPQSHPIFTVQDYSQEFIDFKDTAQLIQELDFVVSVDTSVAHLAGALGIRTFLLTPFDNCWRWFGNKSTSPWYTTMMQFRQPEPGDWASVIEQLAANLTTYYQRKAS
jgi:tetratricopeptide (TPR) repeat protein